MLGDGINHFINIASESYINFLQKKITPTIDNVQHLSDIDKYNLDKSKCILGASASLVVYGLKTTNSDLDMSIEENYRRSLEEQGLIVTVEENGYKHWIIKDTKIDLGLVNDPVPLPYTWFKDLGTITLQGYQFLNLPGITRFYIYLMHHFAKIGNDFYTKKFTTRTIDISKSVCGWFNNTCYHASPISNIKILKPKSSNIYKPSVFTSLFEHFAKLFGVKWSDTDIHLHWDISDKDGITPIFILEFIKPIDKRKITVPYSFYEVSSEHFLPWNFYDQKDTDRHPFVEMVSDRPTIVLKETKYSNWLDSLYDLESQGLLILKGTHFIR